MENNIKELKRIIRNCEKRNVENRKLYKAAVEAGCVYTQKQALASIEFNNKLKASVEERLGV